MYYTDISNSELQQFHNLKAHNFTATLTQILTSPLFKVEEIITDSIYKIYPLFYTGEISSSNSNDKILDNKCIICNKTEDETYYTFISDETSDVQDYIEYGTYYDVGDSLTTAQFNGYISLLRQFVTHDENIHIAETITGLYGTYEFNINNATILDSGIVITDETIQAEPKVKLTDNIFANSNYILKLDVIHYTGANILDDTTSDYKVIDTIEVELVADEWVNIPVETLQQDYIISLNATVDIDHKKPIIYIPDYELTLTSDKDIIQTDETTNLTATLTLDGEALAGETVNFKVYKASDDTLVETLTGTTDSQGIATVSYVGEGAGSLNIKAECMNLTKTYEVKDCTYIDNYVNYGSVSCVQSTTDGVTTLSTQNNNYAVFLFTKTSLLGSAIYIGADECFEFTIVDVNGTITVRTDTSSGTVQGLFNSVSNPSYFESGNQIRLKHTGDAMEVYINDTLSKTVALTDNRRLVFRLEDGATFSFKDLITYPV